MTREEAIDILNDERIVIWTEPDEEEIARKQNEAIDMAIESLSAEPTDLISRADAVRVVEQIFPFSSEMANAKHSCITQLNLLPSADRPHGEWEPSCADIPKNCSVCGEEWDKYVYGAEIWYTGELPKFCPNCGVRMKVR